MKTKKLTCKICKNIRDEVRKLVHKQDMALKHNDDTIEIEAIEFIRRLKEMFDRDDEE